MDGDLAEHVAQCLRPAWRAYSAVEEANLKSAERDILPQRAM